MASLIYLLRRTTINYFKRIRKKPLKLIAPGFILLWLVFMFIPKKDNNKIPSSSPEIFVSIFLVIITGVFIYSIYKGTKSADSKFGMDDVNLVFTAPIRPQTVMIYGLIKKIAVELFASVYILFQLPNILRSYKISSFRLFLIIVSLFVFQFIFCNIIELLVFAVCTKHNELRAIIRNSIRFIILFSAAFLGLFIFKTGIEKGLNTMGYFLTYNSWFKFLPAVGWMREICIQTLLGINLSYYIYFLLIILSSMLLLYITYQLDIDFYEEMLTSAENNDIISRAKNGENISRNNQGKSLFKARRNVELRLNNVYGAKT
ncbi:MAG: putative ABC exporter domain-containing protein, partial [Bacillota bacterium]|nr:putative ABC exporter domain-containing protein [Bacillota bacterium]